MATYKPYQESSLSSEISSLTCDICGSDNITETREGYVCEDCGIVLELQKLQYHRPYSEDLIQYARGSGRTKIGTKQEIRFSPNSATLIRLNKQNTFIHNDKAMIDNIRIEISRLFAALNLSNYTDVKEMVLNKFKKVFPKLDPRTKYRNVEKLVSVLSFFCLKLKNIPINSHELIEHAKIEKKEFNDFMLQIKLFLPEYNSRNRQNYILQRFFEISEHFGLGMPFYFLCKKILFKLWKGIKNTTDNVVAGVVCSIGVLCTRKDKVTVSSICNHLGIRMSTVQSQVKKNIFERFRVEGFTSLIKSSDTLIEIMIKLGLLEGHKSKSEMSQEAQEGIVSNKRVDLILGNAKAIFNIHNNISDYLFAMRGINSAPLMLTCNTYENPLCYNNNTEVNTHYEPFMNFKIYHYYKQKDPPVFS
ncbi:MAG: hypothetical protein ACFFC3_14660 [Candidatus Odinarchaeota archaeon]